MLLLFTAEGLIGRTVPLAVTGERSPAFVRRWRPAGVGASAQIPQGSGAALMFLLELLVVLVF